jgi:hypothetical protein
VQLQLSKYVHQTLFWSLSFNSLFFSALIAEAAPANDSPSQVSKFASIGPWTVSAGFPQGGSSSGTPALSLRNEVAEGGFATLGLNLSSDRQAGSESAGAFLKWNHMLASGWGKSFPYAFVQSGMLIQKVAASSKKETSFLAAAGLGVEVSLIREISTSVETGIGGVMWPSERLSYNAATTQISVHYHFDF